MARIAAGGCKYTNKTARYLSLLFLRNDLIYVPFRANMSLPKGKTHTKRRNIR
nr:MAG TPA: hypothetical protein [Caudoviricetes sp.]